MASSFDIVNEMKNLDVFWDSIIQIPPIKWLFTSVFRIYVYLFVMPTYHFLFRKAPWWVAGFSGREAYDICHQLTGYGMSIEFWKKEENIALCERMIFSKFDSLLSLFVWIFYVIVLVFVVKWAVHSLQQTIFQVCEASYSKMIKRTRQEIQILRRDTTPSPRRRNENNQITNDERLTRSREKTSPV